MPPLLVQWPPEETHAMNPENPDNDRVSPAAAEIAPAEEKSPADVPYWQHAGTRPGWDADARHEPSRKGGSRKWYSRARWELERERCRLSGPPTPPWREASAASDVATSLLRRIGAGSSVALETLRAEWPSVVGEDVARHCRPSVLDGGVLVLSVSDSVWMFTLRRIAATTLLSAVRRHRHGGNVLRIALRPAAPGEICP